MTVRQAAAQMHDRDRLLDVAFDGIGSLSMGVIDRYREQRAREVEAAIKDRQALKRRQDLKETLTAAQKAQQQREVGELDRSDSPAL